MKKSRLKEIQTDVAQERVDEPGGAADTAEKEGGVTSVDRALSVLEAFRPYDPPLTLHELANRTGLYKSTILRLLASLMRHGCVQQLDDGGYQLGSKLLHWGSVYQTSLRLEDHILPLLLRLVSETGEGASFFKREGNSRVCLFHSESPQSIRNHLRSGDLLPLDTGAGGKVLLVFDPSQKVTPPSPIIATFGEREPDIAAVAAPVFGPGNSLLGALSVSGPVFRFTKDRLPSISKALIEAAAELTRRLGGDPRRLTERA
jgi:DNA-binding IclR family transcriptional regulator